LVFSDLQIESMSFKSLPQTTMDRVRESRRREIAAQEEKAKRLSEQAAARSASSNSQQAFAEMAEAGDKTDGASSKVSSRRARAASNHATKLSKPLGTASADFDPFAADTSAAPTPAVATAADFDPFGTTKPMTSPASPAASRAAASDPFDMGSGHNASAAASSPEDDLATLDFTMAPVEGNNAATPSNSSTGAHSVSNAESSAAGKALYDLDDLTGLRTMGGGSGSTTPKRAAPSMAELARVQTNAGNKKPVMMSSSAASSPSGVGATPWQAGGYGQPQQQAPMQQGAPRQANQDADPFAGF
jgi:hypothetical protein